MERARARLEIVTVKVDEPFELDWQDTIVDQWNTKTDEEYKLVVLRRGA